MPFTDITNIGPAPVPGGVVENLAGVIAVSRNNLPLLTQLKEFVGGDDARILLFDLTTWPVNLGFVRQGRFVHVFMDGTTNFQQLLGDVVGITGGYFPGTNQIVQSFFCDNAIFMKQQLENFFGIGNLTNYIWTLSGHSLGGATAGLLGMLLGQICGSGNVYLANYAAPKYCTGGWAGGQAHTGWNMKAGWDPIPFLPLEDGFLKLLIAPGRYLTTLMPSYYHYVPYFSYTNTGTERREINSALVALNTYGFIRDGGVDHILQAHATKCSLWGLFGVLEPRYTGLLNSMQRVVSQPAQDGTLPVPIPLTAQNISDANHIYYPGVDPPPLTAGTIGMLQQAAGDDPTGLIRSSPDIAMINQENGGGRMALAVGYKITLFTRDGDLGVSDSVFTNSTTLANASNDAYEYLRVKIATQGRGMVGGYTSKGSPGINYMRLTPVNNGNANQLIEVPNPLQGNLIGAPADYGGEPLTVALFNRCTSQAGGVRAFRTVWLHGVPDALIDDENYNVNAVGVPLGQFITNINTFFQYWQTGGASGARGSQWMQILTHDPTAPNGACTGSTYANGQWTLNMTGLGTTAAPYSLLAANDRIKISRSNSTGFNGSWKVQSVNATAGTIVLATGPLQGSPNIQNGNWQKIYDKSLNAVCDVFLPITNTSNWTVRSAPGAVYQVRSRRVSKAFTEFRGPKKRKRVVN